MLYPLIKKALFLLDPEVAHNITFRQLKLINNKPFLLSLLRPNLPYKPVNCMGLIFKNPVGLAAGLDKEGECIDALGALGFGFIEVGTVTPRPQAGNEKPRLFRLPDAEALINRMGFNNKGVDNLVENLKRSHYDGIIGVNIGKNRDTPLEQGVEDYLYCMDKVYNYAGYIVINISSPNTPGLRTLQYGTALDELLVAIKQRQQQLTEKYQRTVPITVKIAPDFSHAELVQVADSLVRHQIDGVIATNTTLDKAAVQGLHNSEQEGGLSGRPLQGASTAIIAQLSKELQGRIPIIGVGGVDSLMAAREKIAAGATLIQLYSSFIYHGPGLVKQLVRRL